MSAAASQISITITAADLATAKLQQVQKGVGSLTQTATKSSQALSKIGDTAPLNRVAESMGALGEKGLATARSLERVVSPMTTLTSAATIAGMIELSRRWADMGNQVTKTAYKLNEPVDKLSAMEGAARLAGSSAGAMDKSLQGLQERIYGATFYKDAPATQLFTQLGVAFKDAHGNARDTADVLGDVAEKIKGFSPHAQLTTLQSLGIDEDLLPLLKNGRQGLQDFLKQAQQTGGVMSSEMAANAKKMQNAWTDLALTVEGVGNRIVDSWSGTITKVLDNSTKWIQNNQQLAVSLTKDIGGAILYLGSIKPALWLLRLLGLEALADVAAPLAAPVGALAGAAAISGQMNLPMTDEYGRVIGTWGGQGPPPANPMSLGPSQLPPDEAGRGLLPIILPAIRRTIHDFMGGGTAPAGVPRTGPLFGPQTPEPPIGGLRVPRVSSLLGIGSAQAAEPTPGGPLFGPGAEPPIETNAGDNLSLAFQSILLQRLGQAGGGYPGGGPPAAALGPQALARSPVSPADLRNFFMSPAGGGWSAAQTSGLLAQAQAESGFDAAAQNPSGAGGLFQLTGIRRQQFRLMFGHDVTQGSWQEQARFANLELHNTQQQAGQDLARAQTPGQAGSIGSLEFERPGTTTAEQDAEAAHRARLAELWSLRFAGTPVADNADMGAAGGPAGGVPQPMTGSVTVDVNLRGAPPGTTASATSAGIAYARPPRVETSMPLTQ